MAEDVRSMHYVCTPEEARRLVDEQGRFWVSNCGCRTGRGECARSRVDVCLQFRGVTAASPSGIREITRSEVEAILREAQEKRLVSRPFRDEPTRSETEGICFCCDDCCGYFLNPEERCDPGVRIELTEQDGCNDCLDCVEVCHFGAREAVDGVLRIDRENCYGCGVCAEVCPTECIRMVQRAV